MLGVAREWWFALLLGGAVVLWLSTLFTGEAPPQLASDGEDDPPRYVVEDGVWQRMDDDGQPLYRVAAERIAVYADERIVVARPRVDGLGERSAWQLQAPEGEAPAFSRRLTLSGGVDLAGRWTDGQPLTGFSPELTLDANERLLLTDQAVRLEGPGRRLRGVGLRADWDGEQLQLLGQVKVEYRAP